MLAEADGRVLAHDLVATLQLPPFTNSAVDGYAVRGEDLPSGEARLFRVAGRLQAGHAAGGPPVEPGEAIRIFTGAPMPQGADTVFMQEDVRLDEKGRALLPPGLKRGANVRPAGEDIAIGPRDSAGKSLAAPAGCRRCCGHGPHRHSGAKGE